MLWKFIDFLFVAKFKAYLYFIFIVGAAQSIVSGSAISNFQALSQQTVIVNAKDSAGVNIATGGDLFYVQISNQCTKISNFVCTISVGADNTIPATIFQEMTDNNDGTYSYSWTPDNEGVLSISVIHFKRYSILGTYYNTVDLTGAVANTNFSSTIDYNWGGSNVTLTQGDYVSSEYEAYLKAPITGSVTLYIFVDNFGVLWVDEVK